MNNNYLREVWWDTVYEDQRPSFKKRGGVFCWQSHSQTFRGYTSLTTIAKLELISLVARINCVCNLNSSVATQSFSVKSGSDSVFLC